MSAADLTVPPPMCRLAKATARERLPAGWSSWSRCTTWLCSTFTAASVRCRCRRRSSTSTPMCSPPWHSHSMSLAEALNRRPSAPNTPTASPLAGAAGDWWKVLDAEVYPAAAELGGLSAGAVAGANSRRYIGTLAKSQVRSLDPSVRRVPKDTAVLTISGPQRALAKLMGFIETAPRGGSAGGSSNHTKLPELRPSRSRETASRRAGNRSR